MARVIDQVRPKIFIAENVRGFYTLSGGKYFKLAKAEFESLGYQVHHQLFNAADFGVPQLRQRLIMVGVRNDLKGNFAFPKPLFGPDSAQQKERVPLGAVTDNWIWQFSLVLRQTKNQSNSSERVRTLAKK